MALAAITYRVQPGHDEEIAEIFRDFQRVDSTTLRDEQGSPVGELLGTAVFLSHDVIVRVIDYEGDLARVGAHMAKHPGVHALEARLAPYLSAPRDTATPAAFRRHFAATAMRCISALGSAAPAGATAAAPVGAAARP